MVLFVFIYIPASVIIKLTSFFMERPPSVTFCLFKAWRNRHKGRRLEASTFGIRAPPFLEGHWLAHTLYSHI
jgi:hypothetical protein